VRVVGFGLGGGFKSGFEGGFDRVGFEEEGVEVRFGLSDVDVVESNVLRHRPELETDTADLVEVGGRVVLVVVGVSDLAGRPGTLVSGVVDEGSEPVTLVGGVGDLGPLPGSATANTLAGGVGNSRSDPVTIVLVRPLLRLLLV
jgi:hypothetical protein